MRKLAEGTLWQPMGANEAQIIGKNLKKIRRIGGSLELDLQRYAELPDTVPD